MKAFIATLTLFISLQAMPQGVHKMASMGGITEYDYPNGLKVLLHPDSAEPKIQSLTADQVNAAFRRQIDPDGESIVKAGDFKAAGVYKPGSDR